MITAPVGARIINRQLGLGINLASGEMSAKKQAVLLAAAHKLVGTRRPHESGEAWCARAQAAIDREFAYKFVVRAGADVFCFTRTAEEAEVAAEKYGASFEPWGPHA